MNSSRKALDGLAAGTMLILCLCWGLQQVAVKAAAPAVHPVLQIGLRSGLAALMVAALMAVRGQRVVFSDGSLWPGVVAGLLFAAEFLCVALALLYTTASHVSVFLYTAPIFLVLVLHWRLPDERIDARQWVGVLLAFAGIALAFVEGFTQGEISWRMLAGDALALAGGALWAATTLVVRTTALAEASPTTTLLYQLGIAGVILVALPLAAGSQITTPLPGVAWASLVFQTVVVGFASFLAWFWLLRRYLTSRLSVFSFLTPLFGVAFGVLLLDDPISLYFGGGAVLVLAGIVLVNLPRKAGR